MVLPRADLSTLAWWPPASAAVPFAFLLALSGWMPSGVDSAVWTSIWTLAKSKDTGTRVDLYARTFGDWTRPLVFVTVVTTMVSTALTVIDGFPRAIARTVAVMRSGGRPVDVASDTGGVYWSAIGAIAAITVVVLLRFVGSLTAMIDFATTVSFMTAPVLGALNLRAMTASHVPAEARPGAGMLALAWAGSVLLGGTAVVYLAR